MVHGADEDARYEDLEQEINKEVRILQATFRIKFLKVGEQIEVQPRQEPEIGEARWKVEDDEGFQNLQCCNLKQALETLARLHIEG